MTLPVSVRPGTNGVSHSAPILALTAGTPTAVLPLVAPLWVFTCTAIDQGDATENRIAGSDLAEDVDLRAAIALPAVELLGGSAPPATVIMLGCSISNRLRVVVNRPVSIFTPVSA